MQNFIIIAEVETKDGLIQVRKNDNYSYDVGIIFNDIFTIKHVNVSADGAIRAIAQYLQNNTYLLEQSIKNKSNIVCEKSLLNKSVTWNPVFNEPEDYGVYLVKIKDAGEQTFIGFFDHPTGHRNTGWYLKDGEDYSLIDIVSWSKIPI